VALTNGRENSMILFLCGLQITFSAKISQHSKRCLVYIPKFSEMFYFLNMMY